MPQSCTVLSVETKWVKMLQGMWKVPIPTQSMSVCAEWDGWETLRGWARPHRTWAAGTRVCVQERPSNSHGKSGLTTTVWSRHAIKLVHSYYSKLSNFSRKTNWSCPHTRCSVEAPPRHERRPVASAVAPGFLLVRRSSAQAPRWPGRERCRTRPVERTG